MTESSMDRRISMIHTFIDFISLDEISATYSIFTVPPVSQRHSSISILPLRCCFLPKSRLRAFFPPGQFLLEHILATILEVTINMINSRRKLYDQKKIDDKAVVPESVKKGRPIALRWRTAIDKTDDSTWPPANTCLGDREVTSILKADVSVRHCKSRWPYDFDAIRNVLKTAPNRGHAANTLVECESEGKFGHALFDVTFKGYSFQGDLGAKDAYDFKKNKNPLLVTPNAKYTWSFDAAGVSLYKSIGPIEKIFTNVIYVHSPYHNVIVRILPFISLGIDELRLIDQHF